MSFQVGKLVVVERQVTAPIPSPTPTPTPPPPTTTPTPVPPTTTTTPPVSPPVTTTTSPPPVVVTTTTSTSLPPSTLTTTSSTTTSSSSIISTTTPSSTITAVSSISDPLTTFVFNSQSQSTVVSLVAPTPSGTNAEGSSGSSKKGFFQNTGAVAGVFSVVGIAGLIVAFILVTTCVRRRRARRFDRDVAEAAAQAAATSHVNPALDDDDYPYPDGGYGARPMAYKDDITPHRDLSKSSGHGSLYQDPMSHAQNESYNMADMGGVAGVGALAAGYGAQQHQGYGVQGQNQGPAQGYPQQGFAYGSQNQGGYPQGDPYYAPPPPSRTPDGGYGVAMGMYGRGGEPQQQPPQRQFSQRQPPQKQQYFDQPNAPGQQGQGQTLGYQDQDPFAGRSQLAHPYSQSQSQSQSPPPGAQGGGYYPQQAQAQAQTRSPPPPPSQSPPHAFAPSNAYNAPSAHSHEGLVAGAAGLGAGGLAAGAGRVGKVAHGGGDAPLSTAFALEEDAYDDGQAYAYDGSEDQQHHGVAATGHAFGDEDGAGSVDEDEYAGRRVLKVSLSG
ncbi:hypothetical protein BU17DRAFT_91272 [Hysterangium stoloniferum]|nr:hypothetical protein BU17DRAFT_91272 [Hysterangium stoloniferum]